MPTSPRGCAAAVTAACALALGLTSCGIGPSKDTFIDRGDAICKQTAAAEAKIKIPAKGDLAATSRYITSSATLIDGELKKLRALGKPSADRGRLDDLLSRESDALATLRRAASAATAGQQKSATDLFTQAQGELSDVGAGLRDYGFSICGT